MRWTTPTQWHVTLRFLGRAEPDDAIVGLENVRAGATTARLGPRIALLGRTAVVAPVAGLEAVAAEVARAMAGIGSHVEPLPFHGHLTLARLRDRARCGLVGTEVSGEFPVTRLALVESDTHPRGARYTTRATVALAGTGAGG